MSIYINGTPGYLPAAGTVPKRPVPGFKDVLEKTLPEEDAGTPESPETSEAEQKKIPCFECEVRDKCQHYLELNGGDPSYAENAGTEREFPGDILCTVRSTPQGCSTEYDYTNIYPYLEIYRWYNRTEGSPCLSI